MNLAQITVVGLGAEGWAGLTGPARQAILAAEQVIGSARQLATLPAEVTAQRRAWPSPIDALVEEIVTGGEVCVLASGDPMHYGIGATLARRLGADAVEAGRLRIITHPSAFSLVLARLGWPGDGTTLLSAVGRAPESVLRWAQPGRRLVVYVSGVDGAVKLATCLVTAGFGASLLHVCERLGTDDERISSMTAAVWAEREHDPLTTVAVEVVPDPPGRRFQPVTPGLPDDAFEHDGQISKRHVRACTLTALAPAPGQLLWDIGAGSGSIAIEWMRAEPTARAIAIERSADRAKRATANARKLGVPALQVVVGDAPGALDGLSDSPDAVFVGGGLTSGALDLAWARLSPGGRLVANAVTIEGERILLDACARYGGELVKLSVSHAAPLGGFTAWRPALPIVQWAVWKA